MYAMSLNTLKLVVTGDDFGYCPRRDVGIVECFQAGAISNVSLLVNGNSAASAANLAKRLKQIIGRDTYVVGPINIDHMDFDKTPMNYLVVS